MSRHAVGILNTPFLCGLLFRGSLSEVTFGKYYLQMLFLAKEGKRREILGSLVEGGDLLVHLVGFTLRILLVSGAMWETAAPLVQLVHFTQLHRSV